MGVAEFQCVVRTNPEAHRGRILGLGGQGSFICGSVFCGYDGVGVWDIGWLQEQKGSGR